MPSTLPVSVSDVSPAALAIPKSATRISPSVVSRRLAGLTSRWTTPRAWAASSAAPACSSQRSVSPAGRPRLSRRSATVPPRTSSMTMYGRSFHSPTSKIVTACGSLERRAAASASRVKRARSAGVVRVALGEHLDRDVATERRVAGLVDLAHAAARERLDRRVAGREDVLEAFESPCSPGSSARRRSSNPSREEQPLLRLGRAGHVERPSPSRRPRAGAACCAPSGDVPGPGSSSVGDEPARPRRR